MAVRGVDGPGLHILDVLPEEFGKLEGLEKALAARSEVHPSQTGVDIGLARIGLHTSTILTQLQHGIRPALGQVAQSARNCLSCQMAPVVDV